MNSESNLQRAKARLTSLGWDGETWVAVNPDHPDGHSFVGLTLDLVNKHRDGFDDLDFPGPPGGGASGLKADVDLAKKLDRLGGKKAKKKTVESDPKPEPVSSPPADEGDDDEVPF